MGTRERIVLDTNVLISAIGWRGAEYQLYSRCRSGEPQLAISPELLDELRRVLRYPKLGFDEYEIDEFVSDVLDHAAHVTPSHRLHVVEEDPDDDRVIECAVEAGARFIVSGDRHLLELAAYSGVQILDARSALREIEHT